MKWSEEYIKLKKEFEMFKLILSEYFEKTDQIHEWEEFVNGKRIDFDK